MVAREAKIWGGLNEHYKDALKIYPENQIVFLGLQGSQNYLLDNKHSDIDTKCIITPSLKDLALNKKPVSITHIRNNEEHIDAKDIRLYFDTFLKQNLNFLEILFTDYYFINPLYEEEWNFLIKNRERIARMNPFKAVKSMKGIALEKFHAMEHKYPSKLSIIEKYGYDPKQVSHLIRIRDYIERYISGVEYKKCLIPSDKYYEMIYDMKMGKYNLKEAREIAKNNLDAVVSISDKFCNNIDNEDNLNIKSLLEEIKYNIVVKSIKKELG